MGTFQYKIEIGDTQGERFEEIDALVDTGASHTCLPRETLVSLGIEVMELVSFELADDRIVEY